MYTEIMYGRLTSFVADNTQPAVPLAASAATGAALISSAGNYFQAGDNITILSLGLSVCPMFSLTQYTADLSTYDPMLQVFVSFVHGAAGTSPFQSYVPFSTFENSINQYCTGIAGSQYQMKMGISPNVHPGMALTASAPSAYNGKTFYVDVFAKIQHTQPMITV